MSMKTPMTKSSAPLGTPILESSKSAKVAKSPKTKTPNLRRTKSPRQVLFQSPRNKLLASTTPLLKRLEREMQEKKRLYEAEILACQQKLESAKEYQEKIQGKEDREQMALLQRQREMTEGTFFLRFDSTHL